jgi:hypothetical protein
MFIKILPSVNLASISAQPLRTHKKSSAQGTRCMTTIVVYILYIYIYADDRYDTLAVLTASKLMPIHNMKTNNTFFNGIKFLNTDSNSDVAAKH